VTPDTFAARHPSLWRVAESGADEGVRRHGLLTARRIAELCGLDISDRRPVPIRAALPDGTPVTITDNRPLQPKRLAAILDDCLTPGDWLAMLNDRVFLWPDRRLGAANAAARRKLGLGTEWHRYDTAALLAPVWDRAEIAPFNTGATVRVPPRRGRATFAPLATLDWEIWRRARRTAGVIAGLDAVREVTIRGGAPHASAALVEVLRA
jgi:hypothetical protein